MALSEPETTPSEVLDRAVGLLREQRPDGWEEVRGRVRGRVSSLVSPAQQLAAYVETGDRGSRVSVSTRVLRPTLRDRLTDDQRAVADVDLLTAPLPGEVGARQRLAKVRVDLACRYGLDLQRQGEEVRREVGAVVRELLGTDSAFEAERDVVVRVVDVVLGDPRLG